MVKNNKTAIKGLLVLGGVSTAAASVYTLSSFNFTSIWFTGKRYAIICSIF